MESNTPSPAIAASRPGRCVYRPTDMSGASFAALNFSFLCSAAAPSCQYEPARGLPRGPKETKVKKKTSPQPLFGIWPRHRCQRILPRGAGSDKRESKFLALTFGQAKGGLSCIENLNSKFYIIKYLNF